MTRVTGTIQSLIQGISQQITDSRLPGQHTLMENMRNEVVTGLSRRPPLRFISKLFTSTASVFQTQWYQGQFGGQEHFIAFTPEGVKAFDLTGTEFTVNVGRAAALTYAVDGMSAANQDPLAFTKYEDKLLIANRNRTVRMSTYDKPEDREPLYTRDAVIEIRGGAYYRTFTVEITVGNIMLARVSYTTPDGSDPEHAEFIAPTAIAKVLEALLTGYTVADLSTSNQFTVHLDYSRTTNNDYGFAPDGVVLGDRGVIRAIVQDGWVPPEVPGSNTSAFFGFAVRGASIWINQQSTRIYDYDVTVNDDQGGSLHTLAHKNVTSVEALPTYAPNGMVVKVAGTQSGGFDLYMRYTTAVGKRRLGQDRVFLGTDGPDIVDVNIDSEPTNDAFAGWNSNDTAQFNYAIENYRFFYTTDRPDWIIVALISDFPELLDPGWFPGKTYPTSPGSPGTVRRSGADVIHISAETLRFPNTNGVGFNLAQWSTIRSNRAEELPLGFVFPTTFRVQHGFGKPGVWVEVPAPSEYDSLDADTMPMVLERQSNGSFLLGANRWEKRRAGDNSTNPIPPFIGKNIQAISLFQNRLFLLAGTTLTGSRSLKPLDFWKQSAIQTNDDDPIRLNSSEGSQSTLRHLSEFDRDLVAWAKDAQFTLSGRQVITPATATLPKSTSYSVDVRAAPPIEVGRTVMYPVKLEDYSGLREYFVRSDTAQNEAGEITAAVPRLMTGQIRYMAATTNMNILIVQTRTSARRLFVHEFLWQNQEKVQSAWSYWDFHYPVAHFAFVGETLYVVQRTGAGEYILSSMKFDRVSNPGLSFEFHADNQRMITGVGNTFRWIWDDTSIPWENIIVMQGTGCPEPGREAKILQYNGTNITLDDQMNGGTVYLGIRYPWRFIPTMPHLRDYQGRIDRAGKLIIQKMVARIRAGSGKILVSLFGRAQKELRFEKFDLGEEAQALAAPRLGELETTVPVQETPDRATVEWQGNDGYPAVFRSVSWVGQAYKRGRTMA